MSGRFAGNRVLVTGSSRGIGRAIAEAFLAEGARVVLNGRDEDALDAARGASADPDRVETSAFDVVDADAVDAAVRALEERGPIDVLVNNAGIQRRGPLLDVDPAVWREVVDVNLSGVFLVARAVARGMVDRGRGSIVNICSVQSSIVRPTTAPYAASKTGVVGLTRSMCAEWGPAGVRTNGLAPGYIDTDLNASLVADAEFSDWIVGRTPSRRWGTVDDLTGPALWLASDDARFVNGQIVYVDGGLTAVI